MKKIVLSFGTLGPGGAARVCANLSYLLPDTFETVILVTWAEHPQFYEYDRRAKWFCIEKEIGSKNELLRMIWFRKLIKAEKPDLILSFLEPWNLRVLICTLGLHVKTYVAERNDPHGVNKYWIMDQVEKIIYHLADRIIVQTETIKQFFKGSLEERTYIIYNPVNLSNDVVGKALQTKKENRIVSIARLKPQKKLDVLIKAFAIFCKTNKNYTLTIYGEGPLMDKLKELSLILGISDKVFLPGPSKTIHQDILNANMMCLVSSREGMSNAMLEAMCLGIPCICSRVSGAIDLIKDGENGLLVEIGDIEGLAKKMAFLANNPQEAKTIGENAKDLYNQVNKEFIGKKWMDFLTN